MGSDPTGDWPGAVSRSDRLGRDLGGCGQRLRTVGLDLVAPSNAR
jgi:hypothetical protein